ncbi:MAG: DUF4384 domain-containing protein [Phycisphaeraceae bacterium]|nr:DUF4384 domain-containing protein [Phycisphaeraceae bacterium]
MELASPDAPMTAAMAESWLADRIAPRVRDASRQYGIIDLRDHDALPASWWQSELQGWLADYGLTIRVDNVVWKSAEAAAAEAETAKQNKLERISLARQQEREVEQREAAALAEYQTKRRKIEIEATLSEREREHELQLLEHRHRAELIEANEAIERARREAAKAAMEHDLVLARLRQDAEAVAQAESRDKEAEEHYQTLLNEIDDLKVTLAKVALLPDNMLAQLAAHDARRSNEAAERLVSPEFAISPAALMGLGFRVERQNLVDALRRKCVADGEMVTIRKNELIARDVGTARVKALPINTSLQFEFSTRRCGYATLINIGTSGSVYVHVPNAYVTVDRTKVGPGSYSIPGPELLPRQRLRELGLDYVEVGPNGWEHIAVLISDQPLISSHVLDRSSSESPFVKLTGDEIAELCNTLIDEPGDRWTAGVLSFIVA